MRKTTTIGIDLAKNVIHVHGINQAGKTTFNRQLRRDQFLRFMQQQEPVDVGMEACSGSHYWARLLEEQGHRVNLYPAQHVKAFLLGSKNDSNDARAIAEARTRSNIPTVAVKSEHQLAMLSLHRSRALLVKQKTQLANCVRGLLTEFGIIFPQREKAFREGVAEFLGGGHAEGYLVSSISALYQQWKQLNGQIEALTLDINRVARSDEMAKRLQGVPGVGPISATAFVSTVGDAGHFKNARQLAAWLGLVPRQHSTGGKTTLMGITKRGDRYLRYLLVHGARAALKVAEKSNDPRMKWALDVAKRRGQNRAVVALANKNARVMWALMKHEDTYRCAA